MDQTIASATPQIDAANVIIHDNFRLINVKFMDEAIEMSALSCYETWFHNVRPVLSY
jgi:hypothetical protein